jgi:hypothetical protein
MSYYKAVEVLKCDPRHQSIMPAMKSERSQAQSRLKMAHDHDSPTRLKRDSFNYRQTKLICLLQLNCISMVQDWHSSVVFCMIAAIALVPKLRSRLSADRDSQRD